MICKQCGKALPDDSMFCQYCGASFVEWTERMAIDIEAESPKKADRSEPTTTGSIRYCQKCGGVVDPETKICTKCGKQYFKFPKKQMGRAVVVLLFLAMAGGLAYLYTQNQALVKENESISHQLRKAKLSYTTVYSNYQSITKEYGFYHNHAVIILDNQPYYHSFGCSSLPLLDNKRILNIEAAIDYGYEPCPECQ